MAHSIKIRFLTGEIIADTQAITLPDKETQLLFTIAAGEPSVHSERILDALWPESDGDAARRAFRACLFRLRRHLQSEQIAVRVHGGYTTGRGVEVDIRALRRVFAQIRSTPNPDLSPLEDYYNAIRDGEQARRALGDWFAPFEEMLRTWFQKFGYVLAESSLRGGSIISAAIYARDLLHIDPADPQAADILRRCNALLTRP